VADTRILMLEAAVTISVREVRPAHAGVHVRSRVAVVLGIAPGIHLALLDQVEVKFLSCGADHPLTREVVGSHYPQHGKDKIYRFADQSDRKPLFISALRRVPIAEFDVLSLNIDDALSPTPVRQTVGFTFRLG